MRALRVHAFTPTNLDQTLGIFLLSYHTLFYSLSHKPPVSLITGCVRWDHQGLTFHSISLQVLFTPHRAKNLTVSIKTVPLILFPTCLPEAGDLFPLSRCPASTTWQGWAPTNSDGDDQVSSGLPVGRCFCCFQSSYPCLLHILGSGNRTHSFHIMANKPF